MPITQARDDDWFDTDVPAHAAGGPLPEETGAHVAQTIGPAADGCRTIVLTVDDDVPSAGRDASILDGGLDTHWVMPERGDRRFGRATATARPLVPADDAEVARDADDEPEAATSRLPRTARRPARERAAARWSAQDAPLPRATAEAPGLRRAEEARDAEALRRAGDLRDARRADAVREAEDLRVARRSGVARGPEAGRAVPAPRSRAITEDVVLQGTWAGPADEAVAELPSAEAPVPASWFDEAPVPVEAPEPPEPVDEAPVAPSWFADGARAARAEGPVTSTTPSVPAAPRRRPRRSAGTGFIRRASGPVGGVPGRRTVEISGTPTIPSSPRLVSAERRVVVRSPLASLAERPDRIALWAVLLGVFLILVAATSGHAAGF